MPNFCESEVTIDYIIYSRFFAVWQMCCAKRKKSAFGCSSLTSYGTQGNSYSSTFDAFSTRLQGNQIYELQFYILHNNAHSKESRRMRPGSHREIRTYISSYRRIYSYVGLSVRNCGAVETLYFPLISIVLMFIADSSCRAYKSIILLNLICGINT